MSILPVVCSARSSDLFFIEFIFEYSNMSLLLLLTRTDFRVILQSASLSMLVYPLVTDSHSSNSAKLPSLFQFRISVVLLRCKLFHLFDSNTVYLYFALAVLFFYDSRLSARRIIFETLTSSLSFFNLATKSTIGLAMSSVQNSDRQFQRVEQNVLHFHTMIVSCSLLCTSF